MSRTTKRDQSVIDMEQRGGVFVPLLSNKKTQQGSPRVIRSDITRGRSPESIGKILEKMAVDFFKIMRREMFR